MSPYRFLEHTADVAVEASGPTLDEAYAQAALGMMAVITDPSLVEPRQMRLVEAEGTDPPDALARFLGEVLYLVDAEGMVFSEFAVTLSDGGRRVRAEARGEPFDRARHAYRTEVKAVTRHRLEVDGKAKVVRLLLDL